MLCASGRRDIQRHEADLVRFFGYSFGRAKFVTTRPRNDLTSVAAAIQSPRQISGTKKIRGARSYRCRCGRPVFFRNSIFFRPQPGGPQILTGHANGIITLNIEEADDVKRVEIQKNLHDPYRTLLGYLSA